LNRKVARQAAPVMATYGETCARHRRPPQDPARGRRLPALTVTIRKDLCRGPHPRYFNAKAVRPRRNAGSPERPPDPSTVRRWRATRPSHRDSPCRTTGERIPTFWRCWRVYRASGGVRRLFRARSAPPASASSTTNMCSTRRSTNVDTNPTSSSPAPRMPCCWLKIGGQGAQREIMLAR